MVEDLQILASLDVLSKEDLLKVLLEPENSIVKQYQKLFLLEGVVLEFDDLALEEIVEIQWIKSPGKAFESVVENQL